MPTVLKSYPRYNGYSWLGALGLRILRHGDWSIVQLIRWGARIILSVSHGYRVYRMFANNWFLDATNNISDYCASGCVALPAI